jgi:hypothetical protein
MRRAARATAALALAFLIASEAQAKPLAPQQCDAILESMRKLVRTLNELKFQQGLSIDSLRGTADQVADRSLRESLKRTAGLADRGLNEKTKSAASELSIILEHVAYACDTPPSGHDR